MRLRHFTSLILGLIVLVVGCSKNSPPQSQADKLKSLAAMQLFLTNNADVLQVKYQENETNIQHSLTRLDQLRKTYKTNDQPYLDAQRKVEQMIVFQKLLMAKIESDKMDQQAQAGSH